MKKIKLEMPILEALHSYPSSKDLLKEYGLLCDSCGNFRDETIKSRAELHGVDKDKLLKDLRGLNE